MTDPADLTLVELLPLLETGRPPPPPLQQNGWTPVTPWYDVEIVEVDPRDDEDFVPWFTVLEASDRLERPDDPSWLLHEQRRMSLSNEDHRRQLLAAVVDGAVLGAARLDLPLKDNTHLGEVVLVVHPEHRCRGIGRALEEQVVHRVREAGRSTILSMCDEPPGTAGQSVGRRGALALGYAVAQEEIRRDIDLPLDPGRVAELEGVCAAYGADYDLRSWWDRCPDDLVDDCARLNHAMSTDVPKDQMDWREEVWDVARLRRNEGQAAQMDRTYIGVGAVHRPAGRMVAFTTMGLPRAARRRAYQWETLVLREHRGHRLGMLVKLHALQELHARSPGTAYISTWNAKENVPMIAVNDALGARTNGAVAALQKVV